MYKSNKTKVAPILEDSVECLIFSSSSTEDKCYWEDLCQKLNRTIQKITGNYIWHKEEFKFHLPILQDHTEVLPCHLASTTCFGDNIEDEWFIVHLVFELSKDYNDLIMQIRDNDGEFLLIEAADCLPSWANPERTENRVFIHKNRLHVIPPSIIATDTKLDLDDAIKIIAQLSNKTEASSEIQQCIQQRIGNYPEKIEENLHRSIAKLPVDIATLLTLNPRFIAPLVNTYCNYDEIDAKVCQPLQYKDCVLVNVTFTKCLYAMLMHAKPSKYIKFTEENDKKSVTGQKLTVGYQILTNKPTLNIFSTKQFQNFLRKLSANGYFNGNIEGSKDYQELLQNAKEYYSIMECPINSHVAIEISQLTASSKFAETKIALLENCSSTEQLVEDCEDWLNINTEQLNNLLSSRYGNKAKFHNDGEITAHNVTSKLSSFLMQMSDYEGIETNKMETENIEFDPDDFTNSVQKMLDMITLGNTTLEQASDSDEVDFESGGSGDEIGGMDEELDNIKQVSLKDSQTILHNIMQSMKEEGLSGPSSNLMKTIGLNKRDFLDSDDDE